MAEFFVRRPIVAMVISIIIVILGLLALQKVPVAQYPEIVPPMIQVSADFTGANAINVEQAVATPIEQKVNGVENMLYMKSVNTSDGTMTLQVSFEVGTNLDNANMLTQNRVKLAEPFLPQATKQTGVNVKKSLNFPLLLVSLSSPQGTYDNSFMSNYANINMVDELARIKGVGEVLLYGGSDYAMRVWIKPDLISKLGITIEDIQYALQQQNVITPGGKFGGPPAPKGTENTYTVMLQERLSNEEDFGNIVVKAKENGAFVRMKDIARIELGTLTYSSFSRVNGKQGAVIGFFQIPGSNALAVAEEIKAKMKALSAKFPPDMTYDVSLDTTLAVEAGIEEIIHTLFEAIVLVILVVFIFLQDWRATLIPLLTVPVSLIGTFMVFPLLGFSVNTLSLLGLVLAIGIVVDDAIVVVEAVMHNIEKGLNPKEATVKAMKEVSGPVVAIALILVAVFIPVAATPGITGRLYQQFAITIAISVIFSAINALTLSPALSALLLKPHTEKKGPLAAFFKGFNNMFDKFTNGYTGVAKIFVSKALRSVLVVAVVGVLAAFIGMKVPGGFVPDEDQGYFMMNILLPQGSSIQRTDEVSKQVEGILAKEEGIKSYVTINGFSLLTGANAPNAAFLFVEAKKWDERKETVAKIVERLNKKLAVTIQRGTAIAFGPPPIQGLGTSAGFSMMLQDRGGNTPQFLEAETNKFMAAARKRQEIGSIRTTFNAGSPQIKLDIDRDKAEKLDVAISSISSTIGAFMGGSYVNDFNRFGRQYRVYVQAEAPYRVSPEQMSQFYVRSRQGALVPLNSLVSYRNVSGPEFTNRFNLYRSAEVTGAPAPGFSSMQALNALEELAKASLPPSMGYQWTNVSYQEKQSEGKGGTVFIFALIFVFLILAAQYESWGLPFSVLLGTPFAVFGAFLGLWLARIDNSLIVNNVFAQIGLVMLIGLAAKNAILIVEFAKEEYEKGMGLVEAAMHAAKLRFRPILMTAFAFILGVIPLLRATGAGSQSRVVMGITVFAGMLVATILGVLIVPGLFVFIEKLTGKKKSSTTTDNTTI
ncbi:MAG: efflux RND transporter permease subunit [Sphingobacteriales bacterium]|jgi:HAE1 family hydrophobic/amphiphilic exporter-1